MKSGLTATQIVDVNGRMTTVHKRQDAPQSARKPLLAPAPSIAADKPAVVATRTRLTYPDPITPEELVDFDQKYGARLSRPGYDDKAYAAFSKMISKDTQSLIKRALDSGAVPIDVVMRLLTTFEDRRRNGFVNYGDRLKKCEGYLRAEVLLAERLCTVCPDVTNPAGVSLGSFLGRASVGYSYSTKVDDREIFTYVRSEEELDSLVGVTEFMMRCYEHSGYDGGHIKSKVFQDAVGESHHGVWIANRSLDAYLRENPRAARHAARYAIDRQLGGTVADTQALIKYLNDTDVEGAMNEGWL